MIVRDESDGCSRHANASPAGQIGFGNNRRMAANAVRALKQWRMKDNIYNSHQ